MPPRRRESKAAAYLYYNIEKMIKKNVNHYQLTLILAEAEK